MRVHSQAVVKARVTILSREHPPGRREAVVAHTASAAASAAGEDTPVVAHMAPSAAEVAAVGDTLEEATVSLAMHRQEGVSGVAEMGHNLWQKRNFATSGACTLLPD